MAFRKPTYKLTAPKYGINQYDDPLGLSPDFCQDMENFEQFENFLQTRDGLTSLYATRESGNITAMYPYDESTILYAKDYEIKKVTASGYSVVATLLAGSPKGTFIGKNNNIYYGNDAQNTVISSDLTTSRRLGLPTAAVIDNDDIEYGAGGDIVAGFYRYAIQYIRKDGSTVVDRGGVTYPTAGYDSGEGTGFAGNDNAKFSINVTPSPDNDVTHIRLYRTFRYTSQDEIDGNVPTDFFFITDLDNEAQIYDDTLSDAALVGENDILQEWEFQPLPNSGLMEKVAGRVFTAVGDEIYFTHNFGSSWDGIYFPGSSGSIFYRYKWDGSSWVNTGEIISVSGTIKTPNGRDVTAMKRLGLDLFIFTKDRTFRLRDAGANTLFELEEIPEDIGTVAYNGVTEYDGYLFVYTNEGGHHGIRILLTDHYSQDVTGKRARTELGLVADHTKVFLHAFFDKIFVGYRKSGNYNNYTMMLKKVSGRWGWGRHTINMEYAVTNPAGDVYVFDASARKFFKIDDTVNSDDGVAFESFVKFIPITGKEYSDEVTVISGDLAMVNSGKVEIEYTVAKTVDGGQAVIWPANLPLNQWDEINWNIRDLEDAASGVLDEAQEMWDVAFDTHARGNRIDFTLRKTADEQAKFRELSIDATTRSLK